MVHNNAAESQSEVLTISIEIVHAAELFSKLSATAQEEIIDLIKSLLSEK